MGVLDGKTIIVTGASSGFGEAIAIACAAAGAKVSLVARRAEVLETVAAAIRAEGGDALVCPADVSDDAQIQTGSRERRDRPLVRLMCWSTTPEPTYRNVPSPIPRRRSIAN